MMRNDKYGELTKYGFKSHMEDYMKQLLSNPKTATVDDYLLSFGVDNKKALEMLLKPNNGYSPIMYRTEKIKTNKETGKDTFVIQYKLSKDDYKKKIRALYIMNFEENIVEGCPIEEEIDMESIEDYKRTKRFPKYGKLSTINEEGEGAAGGEGMAGGDAVGSDMGGEAASDCADSNCASGAEQVNHDAPIMPLMGVSGKTVDNMIRRDFLHEGRKTVILTQEQVRRLHKILNEEGIESGMFGNIGFDVPMAADENDPSLNHKNMMADSWQGEMKEGKKIGARKKK